MVNARSDGRVRPASAIPRLTIIKKKYVWVKAQTTAPVMEVARAMIIAKLDDDSAFAARFHRALGKSLSYRLRPDSGARRANKAK